MENKYQIALNKIIRSCCPHCHDDNGCQNCEIKRTCNAIAKYWVDTIQELVDKETPMKPPFKWECAKPQTRCKCSAGVEKYHKYCWNCGQKLGSDSDE